MTIVLNGTTGVTSVNGSAAAPSVTGTDTDTGIVYGTNTVSMATGGTTALTANSAQGVQVLNTLGVGNTTPSTSGAGITFPATQSASTDANTLDDYEEGSWTPTIFTDGGGQSVTYTQQRGTYTKIGRSVTVAFYVGWSAFTGGSGAVRVGGLPFTAQNTGAGVYYTGALGEMSSTITLNANYTMVTFEIAQAATSVLPVQNGSAQGTIGLTRGNYGTGNGYLIATITYDAA